MLFENIYFLVSFFKKKNRIKKTRIPRKNKVACTHSSVPSFFLRVPPTGVSEEVYVEPSTLKGSSSRDSEQNKTKILGKEWLTRLPHPRDDGGGASRYSKSLIPAPQRVRNPTTAGIMQINKSLAQNPQQMQRK